MLQLVVMAAVPFVWFGMVAAISFLETPLKFRAPGITVPLGVGIGRIVFKALNLVELALAATLIVAALTDPKSVPPTAALALAASVLALAVQVLLLRPRMKPRRLPSFAAVTGGTMPAVVSRAPHLGYIAAELVKFAALPIAGISILLAVAG